LKLQVIQQTLAEESVFS